MIRKVFLFLLVISFAVLSAVDLNWMGEYRFRTTYNNTYTNDYDQAVRTDKAINWADMRMRLGTKAVFNENVTLTTQFELKNIYFGNSSAGGGMGTDGRHNLVTRHAYLSLRPGWIPFDFEIGLMKFYDQAHGLILDDDASGVIIKPTSLKNFSFGVIKWYDYWDNPQESDDDTNIYFVQYSREFIKDLAFHCGSYYEYDKGRRYQETPTYDGKPTFEFYAFSSLQYSLFNSLDLDLAFAYNNGHDWRDREHSGYAVSFKPKYTWRNLTLEGTLFMLSAEDDSNVYTEDVEQGLDYSRKYVDVDYFVSISPYYENGLELFGLGVNEHANVDEIMRYIDLGFYGQINYVGKLTWQFHPKVASWFTAGYVSRMAEKYIGNDANGDPEFLQQGVATEYDLGFSLDVVKNVNWKIVGAYAIPNTEYFSNNHNDLYSVSTSLIYKY